MLTTIKKTLWDVPFQMIKNRNGKQKYILIIEFLIAYLFLFLCCSVFIAFIFLIANNLFTVKYIEKIKIVNKEQQEKKFNSEKENYYFVLKKENMISEIKVPSNIYKQYNIGNYVQVKYHYGRFNHKFFVDELIVE